MITLTTILFLIYVFINLKIYRLGIEDGEGFNPVNHGVGLWMGWFLLSCGLGVSFMVFCIKYLP